MEAVLPAWAWACHIPCLMGADGEDVNGCANGAKEG